jgi:multidrug resistance efflux pump
MSPDGAARLNLLAIIAGALFIAIIGLAISILHARALARAGVESTRIDIAPRVSSRLAKVPVARHQDVAAGVTLMLMDNPELVAQRLVHHAF